MKKIKLLTSLTGLSALTIGIVPTIASCSCNKTTEVQIVSIGITTFPQLEFDINSTFNHNGIVVTATNSDGTTKNVTSECAFSTPTMSTAGTKMITVNHTASNKSVQYGIYVKEQAIATCTVSFFTDDTSTPWTKQVALKDGYVHKPTNPTSTNGDFVCWYTAQPTAGVWDETKVFDFDNTKISANTNLYARFDGNFNGVKWSTVKTAIETFESKTTPTADDAVTLCTALGITGATAQTDAKTTLEKYLVGIEGTLILNGRVHYIRCIGAMHDTLEDHAIDNKKAALTFELKTLVSDSNGLVMECYWNKAESNYDYTNSTLRACLTGKGDKTPRWTRIDYQEETETILLCTKSAREMIKDENPELTNLIKPVYKSVLQWNSTLSKYQVGTYADELFTLTQTEMALDTESSEGEAYKFWTDNEAKEEESEKAQTRAKFDIAETKIPTYWTPLGFPYWLATPHADDATEACCISMDGELNEYSPTNISGGVSFAFCI